MNSLKHAEELCRFPLLFPRSHVVLGGAPESFVMNLNERGAGRSCPHSPSLHHHGAAEMVFQLIVHPPTGGDGQVIDVCDNEEQMKKMTVLQLKQIINKTFMITDGDLQLVFGLEPLEEETLLAAHNIKHMSTIHSVLKLPGGV
ncbi:uncharacterized protein AB9X84_015740 [Acanthopagrus schlegelii]